AGDAHVAEVMSEHLLAVAGLRWLDLVPAAGPRAGVGVARGDLARGQLELGGLIQERPAEVHVVEHHMPGVGRSFVAYDVAQAQQTAAEGRRPGALEHEVLAEHARLTHGTRDDEFVADELGACEGGRHDADATVLRVFDAVVDGGRPEAVEAARREQPAAEAAQPLLAVTLGEAGGDHAGRRHPGDGHAAVRHLPEVKRPVGVDVDLEAATRHDANAPGAAGWALLLDEAVDPRQLRERTDAPRELRAVGAVDGGRAHARSCATGPVSAASSRLPGPKCLSSTRSELGELLVMVTPSLTAAAVTKYSSCES